MDIVVKSFYRPYYLERCLRSIHLNIEGDYTITILDDCTPDSYLTRIKELFPEVVILKSQEHKVKLEMISQHISGIKKYDNLSIPAALWKEFITDCSDYFLLLEEDAWIIDTIHIDDIQDTMRQEELLIVKLAWNSNPDLIKGETVALSNEIEELIPNLPINSPTLLKPYFKDTFRIKSVFNKLGLVY